MQLNRPGRAQSPRSHRPSLFRTMPCLFYLLAVISIVNQHYLLMLSLNIQQDEIRENITAYMAVEKDARMQNMGTPDNGFHEKIVSRDQIFVSKGCKTTFDREALAEEE